MELTDIFQNIGTGDTVVYGGSAGHLELWAKYNSKDVANNRTNVTVELRLVIDYGYIGNYQATYWSISGDLSNSGNLGSGDYRSRTLGSATGNITHNADGTKSVSFSGSFNPTAWGYSMGVSGSATLPNLHKPPVINTATMVETNSVLTALNVPDTTVVRYLSKKRITLNVTAFDGATLTYKLRHLNTNYTIPSSGYQSSNIFNVDYTQNDIMLTSNNKAPIIQEVKDSLNGTATDYLFVTINNSTQRPDGIPYAKPTIEKANTSIKRKSGGGTTLTDNKAVLNLKAKIYKTTADVIGNSNNIQQIGYKIWEQNGSEPSSYTPLTPTIDSSGNVTISNLEITNKDYTKTYYYKIIIKDRFGYQDIVEGSLPTGQSVWTEYKDRVDFLNATIGSYPIVESGSNANGNYIKYYDGTMICYKSVTDSVSMTSSWGSLYEGKLALGSWPQEFLSILNVQVTNVSAAGAMIESYDTAPTTTSAGEIYLARGNSSTSNITVNVLAIGKWK